MKKTLFTILVLSLFACNENRVFDQHKDPSGNLEWNRHEVLSFDIEIIDPSLSYDLYLALRYAEGLAYSGIKVLVTETSPSGEVQDFPFTFTTRDEDGYRGEGMVDIWDLEELLVERKRYPEAGTYTYTIRHEMAEDKIHMVMEVGLILERSSK